MSVSSGPSPNERGGQIKVQHHSNLRNPRSVSSQLTTVSSTISGCFDCPPPHSAVVVPGGGSGPLETRTSVGRRTSSLSWIGNLPFRQSFTTFPMRCDDSPRVVVLKLWWPNQGCHRVIYDLRVLRLPSSSFSRCCCPRRGSGPLETRTSVARRTYYVAKNGPGPGAGPPRH